MKCGICGSKVVLRHRVELVLVVRTTRNQINETERRLPLCDDCLAAAKSGRIAFNQFLQAVPPPGGIALPSKCGQDT